MNGDPSYQSEVKATTKLVDKSIKDNKNKLRKISTFTNIPLLYQIEFTNEMVAGEKDFYEASGAVDNKTLNRLLFDELAIKRDILPEEYESNNSKDSNGEENWVAKLFQILIPFCIAGLGMVGAGILLSTVQSWEVFVNLKIIIVLVPTLLGLKGNLDMSLASRLSTQVNLGLVHNRETIIQAVLGNASLKLLQSIVVGFLASLVACLTNYLREPQFNPHHVLILIASSVTSAAITSVILGSLVMTIILVSKKLNINPDNVATPMAGSVGDVGTLTTLAVVGSFFYSYRETIWIHLVFICVILSITPFLVLYAKNNKFVKPTLKHGWAPIIISMLICSISGMILREAISIFHGIESYQPVINGIGGNLVSIYSARLSTEICRDKLSLGGWASWVPKRCFTFPYHTFFGKKNPEAKTARLLMSFVIPGHLILFFINYFLSSFYKHTQPTLTIWFVSYYILAAVIQVTLLFIICFYLVQIIRRFSMNPDDCCIPILTALGDIFGAILLFLCFYLVFLSGDESVRIIQYPINNSTTNATNI